MPLAGVGLRRHEVDGVVVWVGPAVAVDLALGRARARGLVRSAEVVDYGDAAGPATVARVMVAHVGAVRVALADRAFTIAHADDFERWRPEHRRVRVALGDLADALDVAVRTA